MDIGLIFQSVYNIIHDGEDLFEELSKDFYLYANSVYDKVINYYESEKVNFINLISMF